MKKMRISPIDNRSLYFLLIRENKACALVQRGTDDSDVIVELLAPELEDEIRREVDSRLLAEPQSAYMNEIGNWASMKEFCFQSANLYGPFLWAYREPGREGIQCGFDVQVTNCNQTT